MDQRWRTDVVWLDGWRTLAVESATQPCLWLPKPCPSIVVADAVVCSPLSPSVDATSPKVVERICLGCAVVGGLLFLRVDVGVRGLCLRRLPCGRRMDLGEHIVVAIPSPAVSVGHLAHVWSEHWSLGRLDHHVRAGRMITRCRIHPRSGNHQSVRPRNRTSRRRRFLPPG